MNNKIKKFDQYNEGLADKIRAMGSKTRRIVTGESAGEEIQKLSQEQQEKIEKLYWENPTEAAKYLRSIIVKEKNSQFGLGLALTIAGAGMIYKASNFEPPDPDDPPLPPDPPKPNVDDYIVQKGDSWWKIAQEHLPAGASNKEILAYAKQLAADNGAENLYSGKFGSPGLKPDTWTNMASGESVPKSVISAADKLTTGEEIMITPFKGA